MGWSGWASPRALLAPRAASGLDQSFPTPCFPAHSQCLSPLPRGMKVVVPVPVCGPRGPPLWDLETPRLLPVLSWDPAPWGCSCSFWNSGLGLQSCRFPLCVPYPISGRSPSPVGDAVLNVGVWTGLPRQKAAILMHETPSGAIYTSLPQSF